MQAAIQPKIVKFVLFTPSPKASQPKPAVAGKKPRLCFFAYLRIALSGMPA